MPPSKNGKIVTCDFCGFQLYKSSRWVNKHKIVNFYCCMDCQIKAEAGVV